MISYANLFLNKGKESAVSASLSLLQLQLVVVRRGLSRSYSSPPHPVEVVLHLLDCLRQGTRPQLAVDGFVLMLPQVVLFR